MSTPAKQLQMTAQEFLTWEESQEEKHEFLQGETFAMGHRLALD
jgi:Uma2 family endonuclease